MTGWCGEDGYIFNIWKRKFLWIWSSLIWVLDIWWVVTQKGSLRSGRFSCQLCAGYQKTGIFWSWLCPVRNFCNFSWQQSTTHISIGLPHRFWRFIVYNWRYQKFCVSEKVTVIFVWPGSAHDRLTSKWTHKCITHNNRPMPSFIQTGEIWETRGRNTCFWLTIEDSYAP